MPDSWTLPVAVDLSTTAVSSAATFYARLLGWSVDGSGDAVVATVDGVTVATVRPTRTFHSGWSTVFGTADAAATRAGIVVAGGRVYGTDPAGMLRAADPAGATFAVTGGRTPPPPGPGRPSWFEYMTTAPAAADDFYRAALGLSPVRPDGAPDDGFVLFTADGRPVAGRLTLPPELAATIPAGWMVYFGCADVDDSVTVAADLGAAVVVPPRDTPTGRLSTLVDPTGAVFTLLRPAG
ncbi:VOC family protein [Polymorphospora rubra]|uniref:VOC family protein n=1 Tax=Polymorphospora rubra TaxID=338584 RepID=UPI003411C1F4